MIVDINFKNHEFIHIIGSFPTIDINKHYNWFYFECKNCESVLCEKDGSFIFRTKKEMKYLKLPVPFKYLADQLSCEECIIKNIIE